MPKTDLLFLAKNRLVFTRESLATMHENTDWGLVGNLVLQDDGSVDGTYAHLANMSRRMNGEFRHSHFGSPVGAMADFIARSAAEFVAKVDNDTMLPPGWLNACMDVLVRHSELDLLGIENVNAKPSVPAAARSYEAANHIGGIFVARRRAFEGSPLPFGHGTYYGFTAWQRSLTDVVRGWMAPPLPVFLLDRLPLEPWLSLTYTYESLGWQRPWERYPETDFHLWEWCAPKWGREMRFCA